MSFLTSLVSAFKGGGGARVPVSRGFVSPWSHWGAAAFDGGPPGRSPFDYAREVGEAYLANPVAQRAVRIVAEGVGSAPIACADEQLAALIRCSCGAQPLLEVLAAQLSLHGNAYVQIVKDGSGVPVDLFPLRPECRECYRTDRLSGAVRRLLFGREHLDAFSSAKRQSGQSAAALDQGRVRRH